MFFVGDPLFPSQVQSLVALSIGLARDHPADLLSLDVFIAEYFHNRGWDWVTKACEATKRSAARMKGEEREILADRRRKAGECFQGSF